MSTKVLSDMGLKPRSEQEWQAVALFASAARKKADSENVVGSAVYIGDWDKLQIVHDITATAGDASTDTFTLTIQMSMDNVAWYEVGTFTVSEGNDGAAREQMIFIPGTLSIADTNLFVVGSTACGATAVRNHLVGRYIRYTIAIVDNGTNGSWTSSLTVAVMRNDIVRQQEDEIKTVELYSLALRTNEDVAAASDIWEIGDNWSWMQVILNLTVQDTDAGDHLDTYIDLSRDGVRWVNVARFEQGDGNLGAVVELHTLVPGTVDDEDATIVVTSDCAVQVSRPGFAGSFLRARAVITESGTDDEEFTFGIKAFVK